MMVLKISCTRRFRSFHMAVSERQPQLDCSKISSKDVRCEEPSMFFVDIRLPA